MDEVEFLEAGKLISGFFLFILKNNVFSYFICVGLRGGFTNSFQKFFSTAQNYDSLTEEMKKKFPIEEYNEMVARCGGHPSLIYVSD